MEILSKWFESAGGTLDPSMGFTNFPNDGGRGAVVLRDLEEGHVLFSIPRHLTLSTRTSALPKLLGEAWTRHELGSGWSGLILCVLWECAKGASSTWSGYLAMLPTDFNTPMFWSEDELEELNGTAVVDKIGKAQAEEDYYNKIVPVMKSRSDLFSPETAGHYSVEAYHRAGSQILSRSFTVQKWRGEASGEDQEPEDEGDGAEASAAADESQDSMKATGMDVDEDASINSLANEVEAPATADPDEDSDDEDGDNPADVALVPIADMLNARHGCGNAKLFYEPTELKMITTKAISRGEQIWNTYGDPPNSDLLRRYGHVDVLSLATLNPADIAELRADALVKALPAKSQAGAMERVDWWLDEDGDDVFVFETDRALPDALLSFVRLLLLPDQEWTTTREKSKLPKSRPLDADGARVVSAALRARLGEYASTLEADEALLLGDAFASLTPRRRDALVVRVGEKRILHGALAQAEAVAQAAKAKPGAPAAKDDRMGKKRRALDAGATSAKKARR